MTKVNIEKYEETIENLLEKFDFNKAHALFKVMGWTYFDSGETPTVNKLEDTARYILEEALKSSLKNPSENGYCGTGHFEASVYGNELSLKLVFDEQTEYYGE